MSKKPTPDEIRRAIAEAFAPAQEAAARVPVNVDLANLRAAARQLGQSAADIRRIVDRPAPALPRPVVSPRAAEARAQLRRIAYHLESEFGDIDSGLLAHRIRMNDVQ